MNAYAMGCSPPLRRERGGRVLSSATELERAAVSTGASSIFGPGSSAERPETPFPPNGSVNTSSCAPPPAGAGVGAAGVGATFGGLGSAGGAFGERGTGGPRRLERRPEKVETRDVWASLTI